MIRLTLDNSTHRRFKTIKSELVDSITTDSHFVNMMLDNMMKKNKRTKKEDKESGIIQDLDKETGEVVPEQE